MRNLIEAANKLNEDADPQAQAVLDAMARQVFDIETLETRNTDSLDFHSVSVWSIRDAMRKAYEMGRASVEQSSQQSI